MMFLQCYENFLTDVYLQIFTHIYTTFSCEVFELYPVYFRISHSLVIKKKVGKLPLNFVWHREFENGLLLSTWIS